ncbi:EAL domain-containing protein [Coleofasciculus sp. LEGE 07092]|nr:EAL domain-containing protein [Coleofasciculus sp. LEGE 07092]
MERLEVKYNSLFKNTTPVEILSQMPYPLPPAFCGREAQLVKTWFQTIPVPLAILRIADGAILYANEPYRSTYDLTPDFYRNQSERDFLWQVLTTQGYLRDYPVRLQKTDGTLIPGLASLRFVSFNSELVLLGIFQASPQPVENHSLIPNVLCGNAVKFWTLAETIAAAAFICQNNRLLYLNKALCTITGYTHAELLGQNIWELVRADSEVLTAHLSQPSSCHFEVKILTKTAEVRWLDVSTRTIDFQGESGVLVTAFDTTEQKQAEAALKESQRMLSTLMSNLPGMAYRCHFDEHWTMEFVSEGCFSLTGYSPQDLIANRTISFAEIIHPGDRDRIFQEVQGALQQNQPYQLEYRIITATGSQKWVWEQGRGILSAIDELQSLEGFIADITERKRALEEIHLLQTLTQAIDGASDFQSALYVTLSKVCEATNWDLGEAWIKSTDGKVLECSTVWERSIEEGKHQEARDRRAGESHFSVLLDKLSIDLQEFCRHSQTLRFTPDKGLPGRVWLSRQPEWIPDVSCQPDAFFVRSHLAKACGLKAGFAVPIIAHDEVLAVLAFFMFESRQEDRRLVELISTVAAQLGAAIERKQSEEALQQAEAKYRSIFENSLEGIFQTTTDGHFISANPALARLYGYSNPSELMERLTDIEHQLYVDSQRRAEFICLLQENDAVSDFESQVYCKDGSVIWITENARAVRDSNGELLYYEGTVENITEHKLAKEQLQERAFYDALTGLPNRALFMDRLNQAVERAKRRSECGFAVLFLDLDRFKVVNDSLGHLVGDRLLMGIARRLETCLRTEDTVSRLGGDEFTILLENIEETQQATRIAERIQQALMAPFNLDGHEVFTAASIGIVISQEVPQESRATDYDKPEDLLRDADTALYRAKALGRGRYEVFNLTMHQSAVSALKLETDLRRAVEHQEFEIHYQPILSLTANRIEGFEALLRWQHPTKGLVYPAEFMDMAEETGLIIPIGWWMFREACNQLRRWQYFVNTTSEIQVTTDTLTMYVNLSSKQFWQPDLLSQIDQILQETELSGGDLKLEITESCLLENPEESAVILRQLKARKIELCIDDFGTGYSSLNYLHRFPIDTLKIDQSLIGSISEGEGIEEMEDKDNTLPLQIVRTIIMLAHSLGMEVIAEGVETTQQLAQLRALHCEYAQGYLFQKPQDALTTGVLMVN